MSWWMTGAGVIGFVFGWVIALIRIAKNPRIIHLAYDEMVVKIPEPGNVLVQMKQDTVQAIASKTNKFGEQEENEARALVRRG